jgi:tetratricopeptide (TPR) repeat protein
VIYQPADGQLAALPATLKVSLLPKGSPALLGPAQIEAMLHRSLLQVNSLQKQVSALKVGAAQGQGQQADLGAAIARWAQSNGFSSAKADEQVQQWAEGIQQQSGQATAEQKALAELALKHYAAAAQLFNQASDADRQAIGAEDAEEQALQAQVKAMQAAQVALLDKQRSSLRQLLDHSEQAAGADQLSLKYHEATQALEMAAATAQGEYKKHPGDKGFHELWLRAVSDTVSAYRKEGEVAPADQSLPLLAQAAAEFQSLANEYSTLDDRPEIAAAQSGLGIALMREGERAVGDRATALLDQAVEAFQKALEVRTRAAQPHEWAWTQNGLGMALVREVERTGGDKALALLDQAVRAYKNALEVETKADMPQDWAQTEMNLGVALMYEGERAGGEKAMDLFDQAVQAYQHALEVETKADLPQGWAMTEHDLGTALDEEGVRAAGDKAMALLDQAVQAYRHALEVETKADLPQLWAITEQNLGHALTDEGERTSGDKAIALFGQAAQAFRSALEVRTKADLPQDWVATEENLMALYHDGTFQFADALNIGKELADFNPSADNRMNLLEAELTEANFQECIQQAAKLDDQTLAQQKGYMPVRDVIGFACLWGVRENTAALAADQRILARVQADPSYSQSGWSFTGTLHFLSVSPAFANGRASWIALFTAVQNGDAAGMAAALHQLQPLLQQ